MIKNNPYTVDDLFEFLGGTGGSFGDKEVAYLAAKGFTEGDINTRWDKYLTSLGYTTGDVAAKQGKWFRDRLFTLASSRKKGFTITTQDVEMTRTNV